MNPDGTDLVRLDNRICPDQRGQIGFKWIPWPWIPHGSVSWSPDGSRIAFSCGDSYIYLVEPSGENQEALRACDSQVSTLSWSRDEKHIAFACGNRYKALYMINIGDGKVTGITDESGGPSDVQPSWSPDGTKIVFSSNLYGRSDIYVIEVEP